MISQLVVLIKTKLQGKERVKIRKKPQKINQKTCRNYEENMRKRRRSDGGLLLAREGTETKSHNKTDLVSGIDDDDG